MNWDGNNTSYLQLPDRRHQGSLEQFSINDTTDIRLCHRCGGEGHIRKFCNINIHCNFCKSYSHHTSVCRSYANFVWAHPMASSRRTSPAQINRQPERTQPSLEEISVNNTRLYNGAGPGREKTYIRNHTKTLGTGKQCNDSVIYMQLLRSSRECPS